DESDLHPLVADLDNPNRAGLHDGAADLVRPLLTGENMSVGLVFPGLPDTAFLGCCAVPGALEPCDLLRGGDRKTARGNVEADLRRAAAGLEVVGGRRRLAQSADGRLAEAVKFLARRLPLQKGVVPELLDEAGDPFRLGLLARVRAQVPGVGCEE